MSRYSILINEKLSKEKEALDAERALEENCITFTDIREMSNYMLKINIIWIPIHFGFVMIYREFEGVKSVRISTADYMKTKIFLLLYLINQFEAHQAIVFK